jgi:hypothetical protein
MSGTSGAPTAGEEVVREMSSMGSMTGRGGAKVSWSDPDVASLAAWPTTSGDIIITGEE